MTHTCHAPGCKRLVEPRMFACITHWTALPQKIRDAVWREYVPGQESTKRPTWRYMAVQRLALAHLVFKPHSEAAVRKALPYLGDAVRYSREAIKAGLGDPLEGVVPKEWPTMPVVKARGKAKTL
jgi:hypothetical protein